MSQKSNHRSHYNTEIGQQTGVKSTKIYDPGTVLHDLAWIWLTQKRYDFS